MYVGACVLYESTCICAYIFIPHNYSSTNTNNWPTMDSRHHLQVGFHECSCWHVWWVCLRLSQDIKRASLSSPSLRVTLLKVQVLLSDLSAPCIITSPHITSPYLTIPYHTLPYLTANTSCILFVPLNGFGMAAGMSLLKVAMSGSMPSRWILTFLTILDAATANRIKIWQWYDEIKVIVIKQRLRQIAICKHLETENSVLPFLVILINLQNVCHEWCQCTRLRLFAKSKFLGCCGC